MMEEKTPEYYEANRARAHKILDEIIDTIILKNKDYGDSFVVTGEVGASVRIVDKALRLFNILKNNEIKVKDENKEDTVRDMIGYSFMFILRWGK